MRVIHKSKVLIDRAWRNVFRIKNQSIAVASLCFSIAFLMLFTVLMYNSATLLADMTDLPYLDCYSYYGKNYISDPAIIEKEFGIDTSFSRSVGIFRRFKIVKEIFLSTKYEVRTDVYYFSQSGDVRHNEKGVSLYWWVVPDSEYDDDFMKGERLLTKGRHITKEDHDSGAAVVIIDELLAKANSISVGDSISTGEEKFTVVGLFNTTRIEKYPERAKDMPQNMIFSSKEPEEYEERVGIRNIYMRLQEGVSEEQAEEFFAHIKELGHTGLDEGGYYAYEYCITPVSEMNEGYNAGVKTALSIAMLTVASVILISLCALYVMANVIINSRRREILLSKALGERRSNTVLTFLLEIGFVSVPSVALGIGVCYLACREYIKALFLHFASLMTPQSLRNTSSLVIAEHMGTAELLAGYTTPEEIALIAAVIFTSIIILSALFIYIGVKRKQQEKTISLMSERKE